MQCQNFWLFPAILAAVVLVFFALFFNDNEVDKILKRNRLGWEELIKAYRASIAKKDIWEEVRGMWAQKKMNPLQYERKIRQEMEREI